MARAAIVFCLLLAVVVSVAALRKTGSSSDGKIVGGKPIDISKVPYQASLQKKSRHICGGAIIGTRYVLTAAHCVERGSASEYSVRVGSNYHAHGGQKITVKKIMSHPDYNRQTSDSDIAVLELIDPITDKIAKEISLSESEPEAPEKVLVTGWGATREGRPSADILLSVSVPVVNKSICRGLYRYFGSITENMFCAGYMSGGKDSCQGDSGGPAAVNGTLAGVVSWGRGCARANQPGVYTSVSKFIFWIREKTQTK